MKDEVHLSVCLSGYLVGSPLSTASTHTHTFTAVSPPFSLPHNTNLHRTFTRNDGEDRECRPRGAHTGGGGTCGGV